jgi:regulator of sigma E protease
VLFAILIFTAVLWARDVTYRMGFELRGTTDEVTAVVNDVFSDSPADASGLRAGDRIVAINGRPATAETIRPTIQGSGGTPIELTVVRDARRLELRPVRPEASEDYGFVDAATRSVSETWRVTEAIGATIGRLVTGSGRKEISSPVGIVQGSSEALEQGTDAYLVVLGLISLSLALLNLLPLLPLDGGHIAFSLIEGVRGRAVTREVYERVSVVGIALVLLLFFIGLTNDIGRLGE